MVAEYTNKTLDKFMIKIRAVKKIMLESKTCLVYLILF
jgi:hypothetical protein